MCKTIAVYQQNFINGLQVTNKGTFRFTRVLKQNQHQFFRIKVYVSRYNSTDAGFLYLSGIDTLNSKCNTMGVSTSAVDFENIAIDTIDNINEIITPTAKWDKGYIGLIQLIFLKMISEKLKEDHE